MYLKAWGKRFNGELEIRYNVVDETRGMVDQAFIEDETARLRNKLIMAVKMRPIIEQREIMAHYKRFNLH